MKHKLLIAYITLFSIIIASLVYSQTKPVTFIDINAQKAVTGGTNQLALIHFHTL